MYQSRDVTSEVWRAQVRELPKHTVLAGGKAQGEMFGLRIPESGVRCDLGKAQVLPSKADEV